MLFLAVAAGFFADNLREEFGERRQSSEYAGSMVKDLVRDTSNLHYQISLLREAVKTIGDLTDYVRDKKFDQLKNSELYRLTSFHQNPPFRWSRATLDQIKNSGSLRHFKNDTIVFYISQYDAISLHLDQDNFQDQEKYQFASETRAHVVDLNYPEEFIHQILSNADSMAKTDSKYSRQLLTNDLNDVKSMVKAYQLLRDNNANRITELSLLIQDQTRLILLLKRESNSRREGSRPCRYFSFVLSLRPLMMSSIRDKF